MPGCTIERSAFKFLPYWPTSFRSACAPPATARCFPTVTQFAAPRRRIRSRRTCMSRWIRNVKFSTKLLVIMIAGIFPLILLSGLYLGQEQTNIKDVQRELEGLSRYRNLQAMLLPVGVHEIWSTAAATGEGAAEKLQAASDDLTRVMAQQEAVNQRLAQGDEDARRWRQIKAAWKAINASKPANVAEVIRMHSLLRQRILDDRDYIASDSHLVLD